MTRMGILLAALLTVGCYERADGHGTDAGSDGGGDVADARSFCIDRRDSECRRDHFAGRISDDEARACEASVPSACAGATWPDGCAPSSEEAQACIVLLLRVDLAPIPTDELYATYDGCNLCS